MPTDQPISRRTALQAALAAGGAAVLPAAAPQARADDRRASPKRYDMKKSINLWAFPYPQRMTLRECLQLAKDAGFDGIELNYDLDNDLSPKSGPAEYAAIRKTAQEIGIAISGLCSFLFWPYSFANNDPDIRKRGLELATKMTQAAHDLGTENLLVVPGAVHIPWRTDYDPVPNDVCDARAREGVAKLLPLAEKLGVHLNIENIFFNGYLLSPAEMNAFVDGFKSKHVRVHFDTGNIMELLLTNWLSTCYNAPVAPGGIDYVPRRLLLPPLLFPAAGRRRERPPADQGGHRLVQAARRRPGHAPHLPGPGPQRLPRPAPQERRRPGGVPGRGRGRPDTVRQRADRREPRPVVPREPLGRGATSVQHRQRRHHGGDA
jgi:hexulose-6-phosphate isomerase